ncbi:MAG: hypothetical protein ACXWVH_06805 [Caulobacteraceae bacterium]
MGIWVKTARLIGAPRPPKSKPPAFAWKIDRRTGKPVRTWRPAKADDDSSRRRRGPPRPFAPLLPKHAA